MMPSYLLDTHVISELRKPKPHGAVVQWIQSTSSANLCIAAVTIGEIQKGIELTQEQDQLKAADLNQWLNAVCDSFDILPMDALAFRVWARLMHKTSVTLYEDAMIAAIAHVHQLTVATRNVTDFKDFQVPVFNPFL
jgi:toxin FitB